MGCAAPNRGPFANFAGFDALFAPFLKRRDIALIGSDAVLDAGKASPGFPLAVHTFALVAVGVNIFDNLDLEAVAETAARLNRWEFMLTAAPVRVTNGQGRRLTRSPSFNQVPNVSGKDLEVESRAQDATPSSPPDRLKVRPSGLLRRSA